MCRHVSYVKTHGLLSWHQVIVCLLVMHRLCSGSTACLPHIEPSELLTERSTLCDARKAAVRRIWQVTRWSRPAAITSPGLMSWLPAMSVRPALLAQEQSAAPAQYSLC